MDLRDAAKTQRILKEAWLTGLEKAASGEKPAEVPACRDLAGLGMGRVDRLAPGARVAAQTFQRERGCHIERGDDLSYLLEHERSVSERQRVAVHQRKRFLWCQTA